MLIQTNINVLLKLQKKAIPGMERPLTIACHMKIFILDFRKLEILMIRLIT